MTSVRIETRAGWISGKESALIDATQQALSEAFNVLDIPSDVCLLEHPANRFAVPPEATDRFVRVELQTLPVKHDGIKRRFYRAMVAGLARLGVDDDDVKIVIVELPLENWGINGGRSASDLLRSTSVDPGP